MKKIHLIFCCLLLVITAKSQETVVWGTEVVDISSEFSPYDYSAVQALHRPNVLPNGQPQCLETKKHRQRRIHYGVFQHTYQG